MDILLAGAGSRNFLDFIYLNLTAFKPARDLKVSKILAAALNQAWEGFGMCVKVPAKKSTCQSSVVRPI